MHIFTVTIINSSYMFRLQSGHHKAVYTKKYIKKEFYVIYDKRLIIIILHII